ncbi:phosphatidate cytidylyltransferase [Hwanghaeella grinnelliae]|uniref:Phosphatidate cytidylyltransferase n=1 Tax=Hwanghaeella grinnelliae TaxID=2500179 RepID=A0A3S2WCJ4_9PROT|nr:phosphatidate cytidylyltransferase [Hwanghaeella grinnelliae]RVU39323.1 phosphatidate cytidylyltransferase [Hwanghaeella grinnelliae]
MANANGVMAQPPEPASKFRDLVPRIASAAVMLPAAGFLIWHGGQAFAVAVVVICGWMAWELGLLAQAATVIDKLLLVGAELLPLALVAFVAFDQGLIAVPVAIAVLAGIRFGLGRSLSWIGIAGVAYIAAAGIAAIWMRQADGGGDLWILLLLVVVASDVSAYIVGRIVGGPKLAPAISPKKTWSGSIGALAGSASAAALFGMTASLPIIPMVAAALLVSVASQMGDLLESWAKRQAGVKDSGSIIPGHGGALDRLDGFLFATPILACIALAAGGPPATW